MKKKRIILVNIIASFLLCCLICFITISVLYPISLTKYGPYHRPSILLRFSNDNTVIFQGDYYFADNYNNEKDYIYRYSDNCFNPIYSLNKNNGLKIYADESNLYVSSHKTIRVYNRNLDLITSIKTKNSIMNMIVVDKFIYYSSLYAGVSIIKDFSNEQSIELKRGSLNLINGTNIYYSSHGKLFLQSDKNIVFLLEDNNNMLIYHNDFHIIPEKEGYAADLLTNDIYDNKVFIYYSKINNLEDCIVKERYDYRCICDFGECDIYLYDLTTNTFELYWHCDDNIVPLGFDGENIVYYKDGQIISGNAIIQQISKIEVGDYYYEKGDDKFVVGHENCHHFIGYLNNSFLFY